jgi:hypothetical protein
MWWDLRVSHQYRIRSSSVAIFDIQLASCNRPPVMLADKFPTWGILGAIRSRFMVPSMVSILYGPMTVTMNMQCNSVAMPHVSTPFVKLSARRYSLKMTSHPPSYYANFAPKNSRLIKEDDSDIKLRKFSTVSSVSSSRSIQSIKNQWNKFTSLFK